MQAGELRVGTYNVFIGTRNVGETVAVIRRMNADVVALQEVSPRSATALGRELSRDYPHSYFEGGLGMMSRFPLRKPRFQRSRRGINGFLFAEIDSREGPLQIANLHLDPLRSWTIGDKLTLPAQLWRQHDIHRDELAQALGKLRPELPTILLGDFNRASNAAINRLRELGFIDSYASVISNADRVPTLRFSVLGFRLGKRIDFIFHDRAFQTTESMVFSGQPSDHDAVSSLLSRNAKESQPVSEGRRRGEKQNPSKSKSATP